MFLFLILIFSTVLFLINYHYTLWQRLDIAYDKPSIPYGSLRKMRYKERSFGLIISDIYEKYKEKFVGIYLLFKPVILVRDADLVRQILITDFGSFHDRGIYVDEKHDPMSANLLALKNNAWRSLRAKLAPSFSSGKCKAMFETIDNVADKLVRYLEGQLNDGEMRRLEMKGIATTVVTDFASFHDRGLYVDEKYDTMSAHLFSLKGHAWRSLRTKLTPSFSSGKLRAMFETTDNVADKLVQFLNRKLKDGEKHVLEMKNITTTYAIDIIGSVIFGLDIDSFTNPDNEFRQLSDKLFNESGFLQRIHGIMAFVCPPISRFLSRLGVRHNITYRLRDIVKRTIEFREQNGVIRKDLLQLLIQLRNTGKISDDNDEIWKMETAAENLKSMSIDIIAAQAFLFYMAGSETTSATTSFTIYEFAMYPEILKKAQTEVDECLRKHGLKPEGKLTYEAVQDMKYLDLCVMETARKYPGLPFLNRECTQDYLVPGTKFTIKKGTAIIISLLGIHRDAEYFPNPMDYNPERFSEEHMDYNPIAFMPFGEGPRHCIAQRMGVLNVKVALAKILANFNIEPMPRKEVIFKFHTAPVLVPEDLNVGLSKRW